MTNLKLVLIGLSGASSSGKTTLAKLLIKLLPENMVTLIHEDDFFKHDDQIPIDEKYGIANWDSPEALDLPMFIKELENIKRKGIDSISQDLIHNNNVDSLDKYKFKDSFVDDFRLKFTSLLPADCQILLVDGFMMYHDEHLRSKFDIKLLVRAPYETVKRRRAARPGYQTLDSFWVDPPYYFDDFVYKAYKETHSQLFIDNDVECEKGLKPEYGIELFNNTDDTAIETGLLWIHEQIKNYISSADQCGN